MNRHWNLRLAAIGLAASMSTTSAGTDDVQQWKAHSVPLFRCTPDLFR